MAGKKDPITRKSAKDPLAPKQHGQGANNPNRTANLVKYADVLGLTKEEWHERMVRARAIKTALQINLLSAAVDAGLEDLLREAIKTRDPDKAQLLETILKIVGATFRDQVGTPGVQVNVSSNGVEKPLSIKFTDATEVKQDGAEPSDK
jgi:hypothetical protein